MQQSIQEHQRQAARIEMLVQEVAAFSDPHARAVAEELIQTLLDMYGEGLARLLEITAATDTSGLALIDTYASDELLNALFVLHGLHPLDIESRFLQALDQVRSSLKLQGNTLEFVRMEDGIAYLRLQGGCHSCGTPANLQLAIEETLYKAVPDLQGLEVEGVSDQPLRSTMPMTFVPPRRRKASIAE
ncbi:NifU family protein [Ktedonobacteria bacterium brp13]|nr:NifU family protein [Ktedonobacteria bacterium brp13]